MSVLEPAKLTNVGMGKCRCGAPAVQYRVKFPAGGDDVIWTPCPRCDGPLFRGKPA